MTYLLDRVLRYREETLGRIGSVNFPFLPCEDQREMFYGLYEPAVVRFLQTLLRPGDTFLDIGANVGYLSAVAADRVGPSGKVHCFEPEPTHFARLERFADMNPGLHIEVNRVAVSSHDGSANLHVSPHAGWHTTVPGFNDSQFGVAEVIEVPMRCIDSWIEDANLLQEASVRLVKIDVEGAEFQVMCGARRSLKRKAITAYLVEVTPPSDEFPVLAVAEIFDLFGAAGYTARVVGGKSVEPVGASDITRQTNVLWTAN